MMISSVSQLKLPLPSYVWPLLIHCKLFMKFDFKPGMARLCLCTADFLKLFLCRCLYIHVHVCLCVSLPERLLKTGGVMLHDMDPCDSLNKFYSFNQAIVVGIINRRGHGVAMRHGN